LSLHDPLAIHGQSSPAEMEHVLTSAEDAIEQNTTAKMEQMNMIAVGGHIQSH